MKTKDLEGHISTTYAWLRLWIAIVAFALPIVLWLGGHLAAGLPLQGSMSAYYHANNPAGDGPVGSGAMRDEFVGALVAVGMILILYQGITKLEDLALNFAGILAACIAFVPMPWPAASGSSFSLHGFFAVAFFLCIAYVSIFRAADTLPMVPDAARRSRYRRKYVVLGCAMVASPIAAFVLSMFLNATNSVVFFVEWLGIYVFAAYWLLKSREIAEINRAGVGHRFQIKPHGVGQVFSQIALTETGQAT